MIPQRETAFLGTLFRDHCSVRKGQAYDKVFSQGHPPGRTGAADDDAAQLFSSRRRANRPLPRIQELLRGKRSIAYYDSAHTDRLALYALFLARHRSDHRALAAMYLLTATETLRRCAIPRIFDLWGIDIRSWSAVRTLSEQEYVLFQAAKGIWQSQRTITIPELCDRKLVEDKTLELILNAALIAHYGRAMLAFDRLEGRA